MGSPKSSGLVQSAKMAEPEVWIKNFLEEALERVLTIVVAEGTWSQSAKSELHH